MCLMVKTRLYLRLCQRLAYFCFLLAKKDVGNLRSCECLIDILNVLLGGEKNNLFSPDAGQKVQHQIFELDPTFCGGIFPAEL